MTNIKNQIKRIICTALAIVIFLLPMQCFALSASGTDYSRAKSIMLKAVTDRSSTANLTNLKIPEANAGDLYFDFLDEYPELYYASFPSYNYIPGRNLLTKYNICYYQCDDKEFTKAVNKALTLAIKPGMSDLEKALALHDYLVVTCEYDEESEQAGIFSISDTAYGALVNGTAICQGYSLAYNLLLRLSGIEAHMISSEQMNHSWNIVKIGDYWYHVDCTWDDPIFDNDDKPTGYAEHTFFMLSDAAMAVAGPSDPASSGSNSADNWESKRHYGWQSSLKCTDTTYDDGGTWGDLKEAAYSFVTSGNFEDVPADAYYCEAVEWAVEEGVTAGVTATTFEPLSTCTRGQVVTFLWRAMGKPAPESYDNPFNDVKETSFCYSAVLWANEQGITCGTTADTFSPAATCNSAQIITFLWRAMGQPETENKNAAEGEGSEANEYSGKYYEGAYSWAMSEGLFENTDGDFVPSNASPRANIVTYLYRVLGE